MARQGVSCRAVGAGVMLGMALLLSSPPLWAASPSAIQSPMPKPPADLPPAPEAKPEIKSEEKADPKPEAKPEAKPAPAPVSAPMSNEELERLSKAVSERDLKAVEKKLEESRQEQKALQAKAEALAQEINSLQQELISAAGAAQDTEENLSDLEGRLSGLSEREKTLRNELSSRDTQLLEVLTALERQAMRPPEALLVQPMPAADAIRSAILLRSAVPQLHDMAGTLRGQLQELLDLRKQISTQRRDIAREGAKLTKQQTRLNDLLTRKQTLQKSTLEASDAATKRAEDLAASASSMRDLLDRLEVERKRREDEERKRQQEEARRVAALLASKPAAPKPPEPVVAKADPVKVDPARADAPKAEPTPPPDPAETPRASEPAAELQTASVVTPPAPAHGKSQKLRSFEELRGQMPLPARGQITSHYGQTDGTGPTQKGLVLKTRPRAQVVAVADGVVAFAGSFRGYGQLLIMEHSGGYHTLLSGMNRIDAVVGQRILAGEPVGVMDDSDGPSLYVELRQDGQPINPLPWLTARKG